MKGSILEFNSESRQGVVSGDDGKRYSLDIADWKSTALPSTGKRVDFSANEEKAEAVYADTKASEASSKKIAAALFAFFLGAFGAHKFYLGYTKQGVIMLLVFILGFILLGLPSIIIGIIAFIEFILYLVKSDEEFEQTYIIGKKAWF
jgi:TM2 domain-containing membrane protein YozV